ncbi:hypothetical protein DUP91_27935, partial [Salmonella enterica subsp. enterica]|nr:hypothetical protein [Salmonella enterica subsp. enterica]
MISVIAKHWDNAKLQAECSLTFIAVGAGTTKKMAARYAASLVASGRVVLKQKPTYTQSTLWDVNWWFRGSAYVRRLHGGNPVLDCRKGVPQACRGESPTGAQGESPTDAQRGVPQRCQGVPQAGDQFLLNSSDIAAHGSAAPSMPLGHGGHAMAAEKEDKKWPAAGFAKWRITHAAYEGDDMFVAHLRSGKSKRFVLRVNVESDEYDDLEAALQF